MWGRAAAGALACMGEACALGWTFSGGRPVWCRAMAYAAACWSLPCSVAVLFDTSPRAVRHIEGWEAEVLYEGADEEAALRAGKGMATSCGGSFVDPGTSRGVEAGLATLGPEMVEEFPEAAAVVLAGSSGPSRSPPTSAASGGGASTFCRPRPRRSTPTSPSDGPARGAGTGDSRPRPHPSGRPRCVAQAGSTIKLPVMVG